MMKRSHALDALAHDRMIEPVAHQVERDQRIHPRRLNAAPAAVGLLALDDPLRRRAAARRRETAGSGSAFVELLQLFDRPSASREPRNAIEFVFAFPARSISLTSTPSSRTGFFETTIVSGATVPRAQQAKS